MTEAFAVWGQDSGYQSQELPHARTGFNNGATTILERVNDKKESDFQSSLYGSAIQRFLQCVKRSCVHEAVGPESPDLCRPETDRAFIPMSQIRAYLTDDNFKELESILSEIYRASGTNTLIPGKTIIDPKEIVSKRAATFSALLVASKGRYSHDWNYFDFWVDAQLPLTEEYAPSNLREAFEDKDNNFLYNFYKEQWKFCPPVFRKPLRDVHFENDRVLPIISKKQLASNGSPTLWEIKLHTEYNELISKTSKTKLGEELANTFVLKTYFGRDVESYYKSEIETFWQLHSHKNIIGFQGCFTRGDSYNVLLEYADKGTLEDYLRNEVPPTSGEEIIQFWESLFGVLEALMYIQDKASFYMPDKFQGWHYDLKPSNILVVSNGCEERYKWQFKIADLGISHFIRNSPQQDDFRAGDTNGTMTYGAPECYRPMKSPLQASESRLYDIWTFGCILSETLRFMVDGPKGVYQYRTERRTEISTIAGFEDVDCFRDGEKVLDSVRQSHRKSRRILQSQDFITSRIVAMVEEILEAPEARPSATALLDKSRQMITEARQSLKIAMGYSPAMDGPSQNLQPSPPPLLPRTLPRVEKPLETTQSALGSVSQVSVVSNTAFNLSSCDKWVRGCDGGSKPEEKQTVFAYPVRKDQPHSPPTPFLSVIEVLDWKRERKTTKTPRPIKDGYLQDRLKGRDHVFLIDDAASMAAHWSKVTQVFEALAYIVKDTVPQGLDLFFTISADSTKGCKTTSKPLQLLKARRQRGTTDMNLKLNNLLDEYMAALDKPRGLGLVNLKRRAVRPLTLYILTDGIWEAECNPATLIRNLAQKLAKIGKGKSQIGIQFISFGKDSTALSRLEKLDSGLDLNHGIPDIVDTEPCDGNVWKMLLGSINDTFDNSTEGHRSSMESSITIKPLFPIPSSNPRVLDSVITPVPSNTPNSGHLLFPPRDRTLSNNQEEVDLTMQLDGLRLNDHRIPAPGTIPPLHGSANNPPSNKVPILFPDGMPGNARDIGDVMGVVEHEPMLRTFLDSTSKNIKRDLVELLMGEYHQMCDGEGSELLRTCTGSSSTPRSSSQNPWMQSTSSSSSSSKNQKRTRPNGDDPDDWDGGAGRKPTRKKPRECPQPPESGTARRRYDCPYHKHNPMKFRRGGDGKFDACDGNGFSNIGYMKEHLHRAHYERFKCPRCKFLLRPAEYESHSLALQACTPRPEHLGDPDIGFSHAFHIALKARKKSASEEDGKERWTEIYCELFPNEPVPDPFVNKDHESSPFSSSLGPQDISEDARSYEPQEDAVRARIAEHIESSIDGQLLPLTLPIAQGLLAAVPEIIRNVHENAFEAFQQTEPRLDWSPTFNSQQGELLTSYISEPAGREEHFAQRRETTEPGAAAAETAAFSSSLHHHSRQQPLSFDSGYGPSSELTYPSQTPAATSPWRASDPPGREITLSQSQFSHMMKNMSNLTRDVDDLRNKLSQVLPHVTSNSMQSLAMQDRHVTDPTRQSPTQASQSHMLGTGGQNFVPSQPQNSMSSYEIPTDTSRIPLPHTLVPQGRNGTRETTDDYQPSCGQSEYQLGTFSPLFGSSSFPMDDGGTL